MSRGVLRIYLGPAPGVGKTLAMLEEGHRRRERGTDVVVGLVEAHGRARTAQAVEGFEVLPRRAAGQGGPGQGGLDVGGLDVEAVLARRPQVVLVDELARTNAPGSRHAQRWQDVEELLAAGVEVITTVNIEHLESLNDVVEAITGVRQKETVPDAFVRGADQVELVDMSPEALRRRLAHGNVHPPEKVDAALTTYFRPGNLSALRELSLLWVADQVDDALARYRAEKGITASWPARERVVVALTGGAEGEALLRRGARITRLAPGGELMALHVRRSGGLSAAAPDALARQRLLVEALGGSWHEVLGDDVAEAILDFAHGVNATQVVLGASRRRQMASVFAPGVGPAVVRGSGEIDVHIVTHAQAGRAMRRPTASGGLSGLRRRLGWALAAAGAPLLTLLMDRTRWMHDLATELLLYLALTVGVALVGGLWPALLVAVAGGLLANYFFTNPLYALTIDKHENVFAIVILVAVAVAVSAVVDLAARRTVQAARARAEADTLTTLASAVLRGEDALPALLHRVQETFALSCVALLEGAGTTGAGTVLDAAGDVPASTPETLVPVRDGLVLALHGRRLPAQDLKVVTAVAIQAATVVEHDRLRAEAQTGRRERERTAVRTALLAAVSHDLRTPLAGIKASVSSLRSAEVELDDSDQKELLAGIEESTDRLQALIDNLLDMSRLDSGVVIAHSDDVALDEVVPRALAGLPGDRVRIEVPETLPMVRADAGLLERAIANVAENAVRHSPAGEFVLVTAGLVRDALVLRVVDRGPGVPASARQDMFRAFQRLGDAPAGRGLGLGLAVARGFCEATGATLDAEDTPGGGLTMVITLPLVGTNAGDGSIAGTGSGARS